MSELVSSGKESADQSPAPVSGAGVGAGRVVLSDTSVAYIKKRFSECFAFTCGGSNYDTVRGLLEEEFSALTNYYSESQRFYHTLEHIEECLLQYDMYVDWFRSNNEGESRRKRDECIVVLAIFYHDIIYDPKSSMNEGTVLY
mgnify:CR=1 FL=1